MKIGFLTADLSHRSGWSHYSLSLLRALRRHDIAMTVITAANSPDADGLVLHKLLPHLSPAQRFNLPRMALALPGVRALLKDCAIIHAAAEPYAPIGAWAAGQRPYFLTGHGSYVHVDHFRGFPVNRLYRRAFYRAHVVCVSHYTQQVAQQTLPGIHTSVVNNGVDVERFAGIQRVLAPKPTVLTVGGVKARKGTLPLVRAVAVVRQRIPDIQCVILGSADAEPRYTQQVRDEIAQLGLSDCVQMPGFVPEAALMGWYAAAHLFVLPSINTGWKFEGYGLAHIEASAAGLPVIGTTNCGAEDAVDDGITGLLVAQHNIAEALPAAILHLLQNPARAAQMGQAGREKARRQTWDHVAAQMLALYRKSLLTSV